jgi:hypothetical protein
LNRKRTRKAVEMKYNASFNDEKYVVQDFFKRGDTCRILDDLLRYYMFHNDLPRLFLKRFSNLMY